MDTTRQSPRAATAHQRFLFTRGKDLHRLPQGHRPQAAGHERHPGLAVGRLNAADL
jgi:hypothetical protein